MQSKLRNDLSTGHAKERRLTNGAAITFLAADVMLDLPSKAILSGL
jgi:hypothetical protein